MTGPVADELLGQQIEMLVPEQFGFGPIWPSCPQPASPIAGSFWRVLPDTYAHVSDPFVALSMMAATTTTLKLGTGICILPARHPIMTALQAATLDWFSGGRLLFGLLRSCHQCDGARGSVALGSSVFLS